MANGNNLGGENIDLFSLLQLMMNSRQQQLQTILPAITQRRSNIVRKDISGNVIQGPQPRGLNAFYANNPHVRRGEFDPRGVKANRRRQQVIAQEDLGRRQEFARGLLDLAQTFEQLPTQEVMDPHLNKPVQQKIGGNNPVFRGLFTQPDNNF